MVDLLRHTPGINLFEPNKREQLNSPQERLQVLNSHTNQAFFLCFSLPLCALLSGSLHHPSSTLINTIQVRNLFLLLIVSLRVRVWCVNVRGRVGWGVRTGKGSRGKHARHINDARTQRPNIQHTRVNKRQSSCQRATVLPLMDLFQPTEERDTAKKRLSAEM